MGKFTHLLAILVITVLSFNSATAQYTMITDFTGNGAFTGASPHNDQNLISDGTFLYGMTSGGGTNGLGMNGMGTIFKIKISDNTYTKILDFAGAANGANPGGSLISDGTWLYGMTRQGGANDMGTIFKIKISDNTYTKILDFAGAANGANPNGSLISDGTWLYGMTYGGGTNNLGTTFKIKISDYTYIKILDFAGAANGASPCGSIISDGTWLYGMTPGGGTNNLGTTFKIKISDDTYTKILDFTGVNGTGPLGSLISDGTWLYGMTRQGGTNNLGTTFKIKISDNTYTKILDFAGVANGTGPYGSLISDGTWLYGMTYGGGTNNFGTTFKIKISDNTYTKILDFAGPANGASPCGSLLSDGTWLYGMTEGGGTYNIGETFSMGTTFKVKISDNTYTKILDFAGPANGSVPQGSLISDGTFLYGMTWYGGTNNLGTTFKIKISDATYTKILDFTGVNGASPTGSLISDGTWLYGMTEGGGANNLGTAFKIKISDNTYTKILDFEGAANGSSPYGSLISDGTWLYGMTSGGGTNNLGTTFKIKISNNAYSEILNFAGAANGSVPYGSLISDGTWLYGMTQQGGTNDMGTTFKIKISDNSYTKILNFAGAANGGGSGLNGSLISDGTFLYGMTPGGGTNNLGTTFKIKMSDNSYTKILDFAGAANGSYPNGSLISDGTFLYGMTWSGGTNNLGTTFKIKMSDNSYTKILDFAGAANGANPTGSLISDGTWLYGMTQQGGSQGLGTVFKYLVYYPDINIKQAATNIPNNTGTYDFGSVSIGTPQTVTFTIENIGTNLLHLTGTPKVVVAGTGFTLATDAPATVSSAGTATFQVTFTPNIAGTFSGTISIVNDAANKTPYNFAITGTSGIKANQTIAFGALSAKTYGDALFTASATGGASGNPVTFTSQDATIVTCTGTNGSTVTIIKAGTVKIYANQAGNAGYNAATEAEQLLTINAKPITVTVNSSQSKVYGSANPVYSYSVTPALQSGDAFTGALSRATGESVNSYTINQGTLSAGANYTITFVATNFGITAKPITVTANAGQSKVYGSANPVYSYSVTPALQSGDAFTGALSRATGESVNSYTINQGTLSSGANYTITFVTTNFGITAKPITVTANSSQSKVYGSANPVYTYSVTPALQSGDTFSGALSRVAGENVGSYAIGQGTLSAGVNYTITFVAANFSINKATPIITWNKPENITANTALSVTQLNATADVSGIFAYTPPSGSLLIAGANQNLSVVFTPTDNVNYNTANKTVLITITTATDIKDLRENVISVFPNPTNGIVNLSGLSEFSKGRDLTLTLKDISGKTILLKKIESNTSTMSIDISLLTNGIYFINLQIDNEIVVKRVVKI